MNSASRYNLILTIVNRGYSEQVMKAANVGGSTGGTVVLARGAGRHEAEKVLGFSIHPEKEIVLILALREKKQEIMRAICQKCGFCTEAGGLAIAVSVEGAMGLPVTDIEHRLHEEELRQTGT